MAEIFEKPVDNINASPYLDLVMKTNKSNKPAKYQFTVRIRHRFDSELLCHFSKLLKNIERRGTDAGNKFIFQFFRKADAKRAVNLWVDVLTNNA